MISIEPFEAVSTAFDHATMFAFGVPVRRALWIAVGESLATGLAGTLVGVAGGLAVIGWVTRSTLPETLPDLDLVVSVSAGTVAVAVAVGVVAVTIAPLLMTRRLARMDVPSTLRVVE